MSFIQGEFLVHPFPCVWYLTIFLCCFISLAPGWACPAPFPLPLPSAPGSFSFCYHVVILLEHMAYRKRVRGIPLLPTATGRRNCGEDGAQLLWGVYSERWTQSWVAPQELFSGAMEKKVSQKVWSSMERGCLEQWWILPSWRYSALEGTRS